MDLLSPVHKAVRPASVVGGVWQGDRLAVQLPGDAGWRVACSNTLQGQERPCRDITLYHLSHFLFLKLGWLHQLGWITKFLMMKNLFFTLTFSQCLLSELVVQDWRNVWRILQILQQHYNTTPTLAPAGNISVSYSSIFWLRGKRGVIGKIWLSRKSFSLYRWM